MADTAAHHKQMENFMGSEVLMLIIEDLQLQRIDDTADGIDDPAG